MAALPVQLLEIRHAENGVFWLSLQIGTEGFLFRFTSGMPPVGEHPLQVINGERDFEGTFLTGGTGGSGAGRGVAPAVGQLGTGRPSQQGKRI